MNKNTRKMVLEQTCALYFQRQNMMGKWQYKIAVHLGDVIDTQLMGNDD